MLFKEGDNVVVEKRVEEVGDRHCEWNGEGEMDDLIGSHGIVQMVNKDRGYYYIFFPERGESWFLLEECLVSDKEA